MPHILLFGSSGHASVVADCVERGETYKIVGLIDSFRRAGESAFGYRILGTERDVPELMRKHGVSSAFIAIGDNWQRALFTDKLRALAPTLEFVTVVHPGARLSPHATLGAGTVLMPGAVVNANAKLGRFCIVNTNASVDHDGEMQDFSSLAPGAVMGGKAKLGTCSAVALNASVSNGVRIGEHTVVGAGAVALEDVPDLTLALGVPAKVARGRCKGEPYF